MGSSINARNRRKQLYAQVYGELSSTPLQASIDQNVLNFWAKRVLMQMTNNLVKLFVMSCIGH